MNASEVWTKIEVVVLVTVVAVLVWLYAEGESLKTGTVNLRVQFVVANDVYISPRDVPSVTVKFSGPNRSVSAFERLARQSIRMPLEPDPASVTRDLDLRARLEKHPAIQQLNITIDEATPARAEVTVERIGEHKARVELDHTGMTLAGEPTVVPQTVTLHMTGTTRALLDEDLVVYAPLSEVPDLDDRPQGTLINTDVPLRLPEGTNPPQPIVIDPSRASIEFTIRKQTSTATKEGVPIYVRMPVIVSNQYEIVTDMEQRLLAEPVQLSGPREQIDKIQSNQIPIFAELQLSTDDLERGISSKAVHITAPANVTVTSPIPVLKFTIRKRTDGATQ